MSKGALTYFCVVGAVLPFECVVSAESSSRTAGFIDQLYRAAVLQRFPPCDLKRVPFPESLQLLALPDGVRLSSRPRSPTVHHFVSTGVTAEQLYGTALTFWQQIPDEQLDELKEADRARQARLEQQQQAVTQYSAASPHSPAQLSAAERRAIAQEEAAERLAARRLVDLHLRILHDRMEWRKQEQQRRSSQILTPAAAARGQAGQRHSAATSRSCRSEENNGDREEEPQPDSPSPTDESGREPSSCLADSESFSFNAGHSPNGGAAAAADSLLGVDTASPTSPPSSPPSLFSLSRHSSLSPSNLSLEHQSSGDLKLSPTTLQQQQQAGFGVPPQPPAPPSPQWTNGGGATARRVYAPVCLCLLSLYPFFLQSRHVLCELHSGLVSGSRFPLHALISKLMCETPLPPQGKTEIRFTLPSSGGYSSLAFIRPPPNNPLVTCSLPVSLLPEMLDAENVILLVEAALLEQRIVLLSSSLTRLIVAAEAVRRLLFPFQWLHIYIPVLPRCLLDVLMAEQPFIIGCQQLNPSDAERIRTALTGDAVLVDLELNTIARVGSEKQPPLPQLPARYRSQLQHTLAKLELYKPRAQLGEKERRRWQQWDDAYSSPFASRPGRGLCRSHMNTALHQRVSAAFLQLFCSLLHGYRPFLRSPTAASSPSADCSPESSFSLSRFLRRQYKHTAQYDLHGNGLSVPFLDALCRTQAFVQFCEDRIYGSRGGEAEDERGEQADCRFFDESLAARQNLRAAFGSRKLSTAFIDSAAYDVTDSYTVPMPETASLYRYDAWAELQSGLCSPLPS